MTPAQHLAALTASTDAMLAGRIDWREFDAQQRRLWAACRADGCADAVIDLLADVIDAGAEAGILE